MWTQLYDKVVSTIVFNKIQKVGYFQEYWFYGEELRMLSSKGNANILRNWRLLILHILQVPENSNQIRFLPRIEQEAF